jgi:FkbM family methyltransferase
MLRAPEGIRSLREAPILGYCIHRVSHLLLPSDEKVWAQVETGPAKGLWLKLNPRTGQTYLRGEAEPVVQQVLAEHLRPGMVFYDLGANIGLFSLVAARIVGPTGKVFSFEPDPEVAARLRSNIVRNGFSNVTVVEAGLWSSSGKVSFVKADASSPDHGTGRFVSAENVAGVPTRCVSLDDFVASAPPPDVIKCDVEGAEVEALKGAAKLLEEHHPWLLCEIHSESNDKGSRSILSRLGYTVESVDSNHILAQPPATSARSQHASV